eukprot:1161556-Pelagomonas_calceolata.AAC.3
MKSTPSGGRSFAAALEPHRTPALTLNGRSTFVDASFLRISEATKGGTIKMGAVDGRAFEKQTPVILLWTWVVLLVSCETMLQHGST